MAGNNFQVGSSYLRDRDYLKNSDAGVPGPPTQAITNAGNISSATVFGTATVLGARIILAIGIPSAEAFGPAGIVIPPEASVSRSFSISTKPVRARSFSTSTLIRELRGTYRGEYTNDERNQLKDIQPGDTIKNIERDVEEFYTGRSWLTGATHFAPESGKKRARVAPTTAGYRAESGSEDKAFRHYATLEPTRVQTNQGKVNDGASVTVAWPAATVAGNAAIAILAINQNSGPLTVTPPQGYSPVASLQVDGQLGLLVYAKQQILDSEASVVFSSSVARDMVLIITEYAGMPSLDQEWFVDVFDIDDGVGTAPIIGPTDDETIIENELLLGIIAAKQSPTITAPTNNFTPVASDVTSNGTLARRVALSVYEKTALTPESPFIGATLSASQTWIAAVVSFRTFEDENFVTDVEGRVYGTGFQVTSEVGLLLGPKSDPDIHLWRVAPNRLQLDPGDSFAYGAGSELGGNDVQTIYKFGGALPFLRQATQNSSLREVNVIGAAWTKPTVAGDLLIFTVAWEEFYSESDVSGIAGPAGGWTSLNFNNNAGRLGTQSWYKVAAGNDANPSSNWVGKRAVSCVALDYGNMAAAPFDIQVSDISAQPESKISVGPTGMPSQDVSLVVAVMANGSLGFITPTQSSPTKGFSQVRQIEGIDNSGFGVNLGIYHKIARPASTQNIAVNTASAMPTHNVGKIIVFKAATASTLPPLPNRGWISRFASQRGGVAPHVVSTENLLNDAGEVLELGLGGLSSGTAVVQVGGNNSEGSLFLGSAYTIPPDVWAAGSTYKVVVAGRAQFGTTPRTITIRVKLGAVQIDLITYTTKTAGATDAEFRIELEIQCYSLGTTGTVKVSRIAYDRIESGTVGVKLQVDPNPTTIDTQTSKLLDVTAQFNANNGSEFIRSDVRYIERIKG